MPSKSLTRQDVTQALAAKLEPLETVYAMWEAGAAAFDRIDTWSDIDLMIVADDDKVDETLSLIDETISGLSPIDVRFELPQPTWHGHVQVFYRLQNASQFMLIDLVILKQSSENRFLEPEIHGHPYVFFDKIEFTKAPEFEADVFLQRLRERVEYLKVTFDLYQVLVLKEVGRLNWIEALSFYYGFSLRPLVELLRIRYCPQRYNFYTRYIHYDLPHSTVTELEDLYFVRDAEAILDKQRRVQEWFQREMENLQWEQVEGHLKG
jgi:predicted nucleotidyltransferase